jgi:uncharacterized membrane protein YozB (DUF420 family)
MTAIEAGRRTPATVGRPFYLILSLLMAAVFVGGFSQTVPDDFTHRPGLPLLLHVHGAVFTLWVVVFVAQPAFIARRALKLHRQVGMAGAWLAGLMVIMGVAATIFAIHEKFIPPFFPPTVFLVLNLLGIVTFGALIAGGIALRRDAEWHKRLMLCATVSILGPGLGRLLPMASFGDAAPLVMFAAILLFALAGPLADLLVRRKVHPAYAWGVAAIVLSNLLVAPLAMTPPAQALLKHIQGW